MDKIIKKRLAGVKEKFSKLNIDTLMVLVDENRRYLSGFRGHDTQFDESAGALFISESGLILATDSRYEEQAAKEAPLYKVICCKEGLSRQIPSILESLGTKKLGFESIRISLLEYKKITKVIKSRELKVKLVETQNVVENLRAIKNDKEIQLIKKALLIAESVFSGLKGDIRVGMTEKEAAWKIEKGIRESGAESVSFPTIVASGPNSALPHAIPSDRKFKEGEPILFDLGAKVDGYCSDISRTIVIGKPDELFKKIYNIVLDAQSMAIKAIKPGADSRDIDKIARSHIEKSGFKEKFGHSLGHGTGLSIHEQPRLSPLKNSILESHMVFTIEPGIYIPDWGGIRLENMVVVRKNKAEVLNRLDSSKYLKSL
ncbi:MAG: aminopeptidase P family protein [Desulfobacterales bacterium]